MTVDEWNTFYKALFIAFPSFRDFVNQKSSDPAATLDTWFKTLRNVSYQEADFVLQSWINGSSRVEPPKAYEMQYVARVILSQVEFRRNEATKFRLSRQMWEDKTRVEQDRRNDNDLLPMEHCFALAAREWAKHLRREITNEEYRKELKRICSLKADEVDTSAIEMLALVQSA